MNNQVAVQQKDSVNPNNMKNTKEIGIWKAFFNLLVKTKLPWMWVIFTVVASIATSYLGIKFPQYTQKIFTGDLSSSVILLALVALGGTELMRGLYTYLGLVVAAKTNVRMRNKIWSTLLRSPMTFFDKNGAKQLVSRTTEDTTNVSLLVGVEISTAISHFYAIGGSLFVLNQYDKILLSGGIAIVVYLLVIGYASGKVNFKYRRLAQARLAKLTGFLSEILANIPLVKMFANEEKEDRRGKESINEFFKANRKAWVFEEVFLGLGTLSGTILVIITVLLGVVFIPKGNFTTQEWIGFLLFTSVIANAVMSLQRLWTKLKTSQGAVRRISEILYEPQEKYDGISIDTNKEQDIIFNNVSFKYDTKDVLDSVNFTIPHGKTTALVGVSGAGKSTILNLLERYYKPYLGDIKFGDISIEDYKLQDWRNNFAYVSQDLVLFSGTIRDCITYGIERKISEDEIKEAAKSAYILDFINSLEKGLDTDVGEQGSKLSGGQRQRIAVARAILKKSNYILLDEATSNLDAESEHMIDKSLKNLLKGKTVVVITHKISTIKDSDQIVIFESGKISDISNHEDLIKDNELYKRLAELQFKTV